MDLSGDLPPSRRPLLVPVVIATIFLAVIGMSAGLALGAHHKQAIAAQKPQNDPPVVVVSSAPTAPSGPLCTSHTQDVAAQQGVQGPLTQVLKLVTDRSTVYICQDPAGDLFYHANKKTSSGEWTEGTTALFIPGVRQIGDQYVATAQDGVQLRVTTQRLQIVHKDGKIENQPAQ